MWKEHRGRKLRLEAGKQEWCEPIKGLRVKRSRPFQDLPGHEAEQDGSAMDRTWWLREESRV